MVQVEQSFLNREWKMAPFAHIWEAAGITALISGREEAFQPCQDKSRATHPHPKQHLCPAVRTWPRLLSWTGSQALYLLPSLGRKTHKKVLLYPIALCRAQHAPSLHRVFAQGVPVVLVPGIKEWVDILVLETMKASHADEAGLDMTIDRAGF